MKINPMDNCRNPKYEQYCANDKYFKKDKVQLGLLLNLKQFIGESKETFSEYERPFMIVQGGSDKLIDPQVAFDLYTMSKTPEKDK